MLERLPPLPSFLEPSQPLFKFILFLPRQLYCCPARGIFTAHHRDSRPLRRRCFRASGRSRQQTCRTHGRRWRGGRRGWRRTRSRCRLPGPPIWLAGVCFCAPRVFCCSASAPEALSLLELCLACIYPSGRQGLLTCVVGLARSGCVRQHS